MKDEFLIVVILIVDLNYTRNVGARHAVPLPASPWDLFIVLFDNRQNIPGVHRVAFFRVD